MKPNIKLQIYFLIWLVTTLNGFCNQLIAQEITQTIRGIVLDKQSSAPLIGATVTVVNETKQLSVITNQQGYFRIEHVKLGRNDLSVSYIGYHTLLLSNILISSAKETYLTLEMEEKVSTLDEVVVSASSRKDQVKNEMATISARTFTIEETERYAGGIGDVARMAANFAGVTTISDQQNDIVIRGNSSMSLLWRMNGVDIPNPNHFSNAGGTGGGISALNNNVLANSDFYTSAFPAQYGNAISGVFDLRMRNGNDQKHEFLTQMAFNGFEVGAEGPIYHRNDSIVNPSYLINYRYSTIDLVDKVVPLEQLGLNDVPQYQDLSFRFNVPVNSRQVLSLWGIGGKSSLNVEENVDDPDSWANKNYGENEQFISDFGVVALNYKYFINPKIFLQSNLYSTGTQISSLEDTFTIANPNPFLTQEFNNYEQTNAANIDINYKINSRNTVVMGGTMKQTRYYYKDKQFQSIESKYRTYGMLDINFFQTKSYIQWKHNVNQSLELVSGLNSLYFDENQQFSVEPRLGARYSPDEKQSFNLGMGLDNFIAPLAVYAMQVELTEGSLYKPNENLKFLKSIQWVAGYDRLLGPKLRMKTEVYYQYQYKVPVSVSIPEYSLLNVFSGYDAPNVPDSLINKGTGQNYGFELTLEKFLSNGYYFLFTTSLFRSDYKGYDKITRNTAFDSRYILNLLAGKEFKARKYNTWNIDLKGMIGGTRRYVPFKTVLSTNGIYKKEYDWSRAYQDQLPGPLFRINLRVSYTWNRPAYNLQMAVDIMNVTNHKNIFFRTYDEKTGEIITIYQFPFFPVVLIRAMF